jgi:hypothetical protein
MVTQLNDKCVMFCVAEYANGPSRAAGVHHVVFAVPQEQLSDTVQFFSELGFRFQTIELEDVGLQVLLTGTADLNW